MSMVYKFLILLGVCNFGLFYMVHASSVEFIDNKQNLDLEESKPAVVLSDEELWNREIVSRLDLMIKNSLNSIRKDFKSYSEGLRFDSRINHLLEVRLEECIEYCMDHEPLDHENHTKASKFFSDFCNNEEFKSLDQQAEVAVRPFIQRMQRYLDNRLIQLNNESYLHKENLEKLPKICSICKTFNFVMVSQDTKELEHESLLDDETI